MSAFAFYTLPFLFGLGIGSYFSPTVTSSIIEEKKEPVDNKQPLDEKLQKEIVSFNPKNLKHIRPDEMEKNKKLDFQGIDLDTLLNDELRSRFEILHTDQPQKESMSDSFYES